MVDQKSFAAFKLFLQSEDAIVCKFFFDIHFQIIKQKVYLLLEILDQLRNPNIDFFFLVKLWYISIPVNCSFKTRL